ncbi:MAG: DUF1573 domain-containing protein [Chitinophagaceae bacterium]
MKTWIIPALLILFSGGCRHSARTGDGKLVDNNIELLKKLPDSALTKIDFYPAVYVFDTTQKGVIVNGTFCIKNTGSNNFIVHAVKSLCDCTTPSYNKRSIISGDSLQLDFSLNTKDFKQGYNDRFINLYGNFFPYYRNLKIEVYIR